MTEPIELRTERLLLRPFRLSDIDGVLEYGSDPEWARFSPQPYDRGEAEDLVARGVLTSWNNKPMFAIEVGGAVVGMVELSIDGSGSAELGYDVAKPHWGQGLATEASRAAVDWAFREFGLAKVFAYADLRNSQSWRVMDKLGMTREGLFRGSGTHRGVRKDSVSYGVLREEWRGPTGPLQPVTAPAAAGEKMPGGAPHPELRTARLLLRHFRPDDVDDVFAYARDPEWAEYLLNSVPNPYTRRNAEEFVAFQMRASAEDAPTWAIVLGGTVAGGIGLDIDLARRTGSLHYGLGRAHWGSGIMTEAVHAVVNWGFGARGLAKVWARADTAMSVRPG